MSLIPGVVPAAAASGQAGHINFTRNATSAFDGYTSGATATQQQWIQSHYSGMVGYSPYFDQALSWAPPTDFYRDLYAIYTDSSLAQQHPDWILRDSSGNKLFIKWACNGTSCTQYAADIGNPAFRQYWIDKAGADLAKGYGGILIDDVNMLMRISDGAGVLTPPVDPRTGQLMPDADWRRYMAEFTEQIRAQFPDAEIIHNALWKADKNDPYVQREIDSADVIELERGFNDTGLTGGTGTYGFETYLAHIDWLHSRGKSVLLAPYLSNASQRQLEIASYFLISNGSDAISSDYQSDPDNWWSKWEMDLGAAQGARYSWNGLLRRDFAGGFVLVNQPEEHTKTVSLGGTYTDLDGGSVSSVTLGARQGAVLVGATPAPAPAPGPDSDLALDTSESAGGKGRGGGHGGRNKKVKAGSAIVAGTAVASVSGTRTYNKSIRVRIDVRQRTGNGWAMVERAEARAGRRGHFRKRFHALPPGRYLATAHTLSRVPSRVKVGRAYRSFTIR